MMDQGQQDQALAQLRDGLPPIWWAIYVGCIQQGFTPDQSLKLVITFINRNATTE